MLRILHLEDDRRDAELVHRALAADDIVAEIERVETEADFTNRLLNGKFDLILADFSLPTFDGVTALRCACQKCPDVPFIFVSGAIGEEVAIESLKTGATDYVLKNRIQRLPIAVRRALKQVKEEAARKRTADELHKTSDTLQTLIQASPVAIVALDLDRKVTLWNSAAERMFGWTEAEVSGRTLPTVPEEDLPNQFKLRQRFLEEGLTISDFETRRIRKDGSIIDVSISFAPLHDPDGNIKGTMGIIADITERKHAEQERLKAAEEYKLLFDSNPAPMWLFDRETLGFIAVNQAAINHYGYSREEFLSMTIKDIRPPAEIPKLLEALIHPQRGPENSGIWKHRKKDGTVIDVEISASGVNFEGRPAELVLAKDVTERIHAEAQLRLQRVALESAANAIVITDESGNIIWVNTAFTQTTGYSSQEVVGKNVRLLKSGKQDRAFYQEMWDTILSGRVWHDTITNRRKDGSLNREHMTITPITDDAGEITHFVAIKQDVTELQNALSELQTKNHELASMTQQLWQASKLATMGELAASVAHELNNPLATISLRVENFQLQLGEDDPRRAPLNVVSQEVDRMARLVDNLLQFSRRSHRQISTVNVAEEIASSINFIAYYLRNRKVKTIFEFASGLPTIQADRQQIRQLFLNLLTNAADAMPNGGTLITRTTDSEINNHRAVQIEFIDSGIGIAKENLDRIWDSFFTTKPEGKGTGLGLAICRRIVEEHQGTIEIESEVNRRTTVRMHFPATNGAVHNND